MKIDELEASYTPPEPEEDETDEKDDKFEDNEESLTEAISLLETCLIEMELVVQRSSRGKAVSYKKQKELSDLALEITAFLDNFIDLKQLDAKVDEEANSNDDKLVKLNDWRDDF